MVGTAFSAYSAYATNAAASPAAGDALLVSLGVNLLSSGIAALCDRGVFRAKREFQETLANHDIMRLLTTAWGEACHATVEAYGNSKAGDRNHPPSITSVPPAPEFLELCRKLKAEDFSAGAISIANLDAALNESRRALVSVDPNSPEGIQQIDQHAQTLRAAMVDSVISTLTSKLSRLEPNAALPEDFRAFLEGLDPVFPGGILGQLSLRVAFHLKTDERARIAIVHYSLQQIADAQAEASEALNRIETLCDSIARTLTTSQQQFVSAFEAKIEAQIKASLPDLLDQAFQGMVLPPLEAPFAANGGAQAFTYRMRATAFVGRQAALRELVDFVSDDRPGLWTVITGPAGSGKSRLAAELLAKARRTKEERAGAVAPGEWRAGFLRAGRHWLEQEAVRWKPDADTLIVIDYASEFDARILGDFLAHLGRSASDGATTYGCRVRVVLIDRLPADSEFGIAARLVRGKDHGEEIRQNRWVSSRSETPLAASLPANQRISSDPLELPPLDETGAMAVARDWAGDAWTADVESIVRKALREDEELQRPLFAALVGESIRTGGLSTGVLNPVLVANQAIVRLFGERTGDEVDHAARVILAVATAGQGVPSSIVSRALICRLTGVPSCSNVLLEQVRKHLLSWVTLTSDGWIPPLEPDFLGGLFVLECLSRLDSEAEAQCCASMMEIAWSQGRNARGFVARVVSDFLARSGLAAEALSTIDVRVDAGRVRGLMARIVQTCVTPQALGKGGPDALGSAVYLASRTGNIATSRLFLEALEGAYQSGAAPDRATILPEALARAWFAFSVSADLPAEAQAHAAEAVVRMRELLRQSNSDSVAGWLAQALFNASVREQDAQRSLEIAGHIGAIRQQHDTAEIALQQAQALFNATVDEQDAQRRLEIAGQIGAIRQQHDTAEIALAQAKALANATVVEQDAQRSLEIAGQIGAIRQQHDTAEIALQQAQALCNATVDEQDAQRSLEIAGQIGAIRQQHDTAEIALAQATALANATVREQDAQRCLEIARQIGAIRQQHDTAEIALQQANALCNATVREQDAQRCLEIARQIGAIRQQHDTAEIALQQANALYNATVGEQDAQRCLKIARQIGAIRQQHDTAEIALQQANALYNATVGEQDAQRCLEIAGQIGAIRQQHDTAEIAIQQAKALHNATVVEQDAQRSLEIARQIGAIRQQHDTAEIAHMEAFAIAFTAARESHHSERAALVDCIAAILQQHNTPEIKEVYRLALDLLK